MAKHRSHSIEFKRQVAQEFLAGETLHGLAKRHDLSRNLIRIWVRGTKLASSTKTPPQPTWWLRLCGGRSRRLVPACRRLCD